MEVQLSAEVVVGSGVTLPLVQVSILVLKLALVAVKDRVVSPFLFQQQQKFVVVLLLFWVLLEFLGACWIWERKEKRRRGVGRGERGSQE